jgi:hypothetical protein
MTLQDIAPRAANLDLKVLWADVGRHGHTKPTAGVGRSNIERMLLYVARSAPVKGLWTKPRAAAN